MLSHYYTDPIHPFHTAQTDAENAIHRACEWSINRSYDELAKLGREPRQPRTEGERLYPRAGADGGVEELAAASTALNSMASRPES